MVIIMDANTGKVIREPEDYGDEVLNAGWLPRPEPSLQLEQAEHAEHHVEAPPVPPGEIDAFLRAMYEHQE